MINNSENFTPANIPVGKTPSSKAKVRENKQKRDLATMIGRLPVGTASIAIERLASLGTKKEQFSKTSTLATPELANIIVEPPLQQPHAAVMTPEVTSALNLSASGQRRLIRKNNLVRTHWSKQPAKVCRVPEIPPASSCSVLPVSVWSAIKPEVRQLKRDTRFFKLSH